MPTGHTRVLGAQDEADIVARFQAGESRQHIAQSYSTRAHRITPILLRHGLQPPSHHDPKLTPLQQIEAVQRYEAGERMGALAAHFNVHVATLRKYVKRAQGVKRINARWRVWHDEEIEQMRQWSAEGVSQVDIAARLGTHQNTVSRLMREHGIQPAHGFGHAHGERHGSWKGGRAIHGSGYALVRVSRDDPMAAMRSQTGYVPEHRLVLARALGRPLLDSESVHHVNGDKLDNRLENLQLRHGWHGNGVAYRCAECGSHNIVPVELHE